MEKNRNILILDTATPFLYLEFFSFSLTDFKNTSSDEKILPMFTSQKKIFEKVNREKDNWLSEQYRIFTQDLPQVDVFFIGEGPGSFTSLRISFAFLKTLAMLQKTPIYSFSSIDFYEKFLVNENQTNFNNNKKYLLIRANKNLFYGKNIVNNEENNIILAKDYNWWMSFFENNKNYFHNQQINIWNNSWMSRKNITDSPIHLWSKNINIIDKPKLQNNTQEYFYKHPEIMSSNKNTWKSIFPKYGHNINYVAKKQINYWK